VLHSSFVTTLVFLGNTEQPFGSAIPEEEAEAESRNKNIQESHAQVTPVIFLKPQNFISKMPLYIKYKIQQVIYLKYDHLHRSKHKQTQLNIYKNTTK